MKQKQKGKDRIFIIVMSIIVANLTYMLFQIIPYLVTVEPGNVQGWTLAIVNIVGIVGALWLIREERRRRRVGKTTKGNPSKQETESREEA